MTRCKGLVDACILHNNCPKYLYNIVRSLHRSTIVATNIRGASLLCIAKYVSNAYSRVFVHLAAQF
jgi:hypothetical protein